MVKRVSFRPYLFVLFAIMVMMFCWESNRIQAALLDSSIPEDAIRIRILANSDAPKDQWIKREVQNEVVQEIGKWVLDPNGLEEARAIIKANIPALASLVEEVLISNGYSMEYKVELGTVAFPAKQFGSVVYPAGNYESLRIVLGSGEGQNWWCVLFPPLCFVGVKAKSAEANTEAVISNSVSDKKAVVKAGEKTNAANVENASISTVKASKNINAVNEMQEGITTVASGKAVAAADSSMAPEVEVKSFFWEVTKKVTFKFKRLFA